MILKVFFQEMKDEGSQILFQRIFFLSGIAIAEGERVPRLIEPDQFVFRTDFFKGIGEELGLVSIDGGVFFSVENQCGG